MKLEAFLICDAATLSGGKLNILGAFDQIRTERVPSKHFNSAVVVRLRVHPEDRGEHEIAVRLADPLGEPVLPELKGTLIVDPGEGTQASRVNVILAIQSMDLMEFGEYSVQLYIDGEPFSQMPFYVSPLDAQVESAQVGG